MLFYLVKFGRLVLVAIMALVSVLVIGVFTTDSSFAPTAHAAIPSSSGNAAQATDAISQIISNPSYTHSLWGYTAADSATGEVLLSQSSDKMFVPGSILKTYSTVAALDAYTPDYRFHTPVYRLGELKGDVLTGNLVLVASGDFSFGLREQQDGTLAFNS